ncbi:sugar phosphate isomerase/epimerase family protein [Vallitalea okinawensis]|uniref:sugar phosphate isomerase/epimerase family protein n=1 Tax=Vallitalea okinawensis TaxID=2078660 RepID=UPI000CFB8F23|nr:sugar phosphate isomerase/epimerase [Vallitalea okinawensis]
MKIAAQLYTIRDYIQSKEDMDQSFTKIKAMGYDVVQMSGMGVVDDEKATYIKELAEKHGLEICVTHMSYDQLINDLDNVIKYHQMWNCKYVGIGSMPNELRSIEGYYTFIKEANQIGEKLASFDMKFVYHNHRFEYEKYDGKSGMEILLEGFNEHVQFLLDLYWVQAGGASPVAWINKLAGKLDIVHFKDMGVKDNENYFAEVGTGNLEWSAIIDACEKAGVKYAAVERDSGDVGAFETLALSRKYLKDQHSL